MSEAAHPAIADRAPGLVAGRASSAASGSSAGGALLNRARAGGVAGSRANASASSGYLPTDGRARRAAIVELRTASRRRNATTQGFIETHRATATTACSRTCCRPAGAHAPRGRRGPDRPHESIRMARIDAWRAEADPIGKRPAIFLLQA
jgi:hypothetical protein